VWSFAHGYYTIYMELIQMKKVYYDAGNRIRYLREKQHYTREQLAEMADISPKFLYEIESGQKGFSADTLVRLSEALDTNAYYILFGEYRGKVDGDVMRLYSYFDDKQRESIAEILEIVYKITRM